MSLTLRQIVGLEVFRQSRARVVAGRGNLDNTVRWVHVTELPDIAHLLSGGELILTTGMAISDDDAMQARYIRDLADAGISGIVVELGRNFARLPVALVSAAEEAGLPLITLDKETRFVDVTETVHREIINQQYELLRRAEDVSRNLTKLILGGANATQIVSHLAEIFANHVILEDDTHEVVEIAGPTRGTVEILDAWAEHSCTGHDEGTRGAVHFQNGSPACMWVGLWLRNKPWGRLHVISSATRFEESSELLVDRAGAALSLSLLLESDAAHMVDRARSALMGEVVAGRHGSGLEFLQRARSLGADLDDGPLIVIAVEPTQSQRPPTHHRLTEEDRLQSRLALATELRIAAELQGCTALVGSSGDRVFAVLSCSRKLSPPAQVNEILALAIERASQSAPSCEFVAGVSGEVTADSLERGVKEAASALEFSRGVDGTRPVQHYSDMGTFQLLMSLADGPELARFVESELRELLDHDARTKSELIPTLRAYLLHAGRKSEVARDLGVQRRTLYSRIARLEDLLKRELDHQDTRTRLTLALQGLDVLNDRQFVARQSRRR